MKRRRGEFCLVNPLRNRFIGDFPYILLTYSFKTFSPPLLYYSFHLTKGFGMRLLDCVVRVGVVDLILMTHQESVLSYDHIY